METTVHFAKFLGKKILHENKEYILQSISLDHLSVLNGSEVPIPKAIRECKIICDYPEQVRKHEVPPELVVIRGNNEYINADLLLGRSDEEIENDILDAICYCAGITRHELETVKSRKIEYRQSRQMHMVIRYFLIKNKKETLSRVGSIYGLDHATVVHATEKIKAALNGFDIDFREKFREVWDMVSKTYPERAKKHELNLNWL